ncbi:hypothetical protein MW322_001189 [Klebsiella pneumoniae]|nr:hypothetical protein [Klebsiella pneumoniae]
MIPTFNHQLINTNLTYSGISSPCNDGDGFFLAFVTLAEFKNVVFMALIKTRSRPGFFIVCRMRRRWRSGMSPGDAALDLLRRAAQHKTANITK